MFDCLPIVRLKNSTLKKLPLSVALIGYPKKEVLVHVITVNYKRGACPWIDSAISAERMTNGRCYLTPRLFDRERENKPHDFIIGDFFPALANNWFSICLRFCYSLNSITYFAALVPLIFYFNVKKKNCLWSQPRDLILPDDSDESAQREKQFQDTSRCDRADSQFFCFCAIVRREGKKIKYIQLQQ